MSSWEAKIHSLVDTRVDRGVVVQSTMGSISDKFSAKVPQAVPT
jgi:hypothetical protein